jgi:hypothetical protein
MEEEEKPVSDGEEEESDEEADADDAEVPPASGTNLPFTPSNHHQGMKVKEGSRLEGLG